MEIRKSSNDELLRLLEGGGEHSLEAEAVLKLRRTFSFFQDLAHEDELRSTPSWKVGRLTLDAKGVWSLAVSGRLRLSFRIEQGAIEIIDLIQVASS